MLLSVLVLKLPKKKRLEAKLKQKKRKQKKSKKKSKQIYLTNFFINIKTLALNIEKIDGLWIMNQGLFCVRKAAENKKQQFSLGYPKIVAKIISLNIF